MIYIGKNIARPYSVTTVGVWSNSRKRVPHIGHWQHLCYMCASGEYTLNQIKRLVKNAKFICRKCGRVTEKNENYTLPPLQRCSPTFSGDESPNPKKVLIFLIENN